MKDQDIFMGNQDSEVQEVDQDRGLAHQNSRKLRLVNLAKVTCQDSILQISFKFAFYSLIQGSTDFADKLGSLNITVAHKYIAFLVDLCAVEFPVR